MQPVIKSMGLGDIFENLFKLTGKTAIRNLIVAAILLLPTSLIFVYGINTFFNAIVNLAKHKDGFGGMSSESFYSLISTFSIYGISIFIFTVGTVLATLSITIISANQFAGNKISWVEGLRQTFSMKFWRTLGASIIEGFAAFGILLIPIIVFIALASTKNGVAIFIGVLIILAAIAAIIFVAIRWTFTFTTIAYENIGVIDSLKRSWNLVEGYWWRTFGILILLNILVSFAISIITTPVSFAVMWDIFADLFSKINSNSYNEPDPLEVLKSFSSMGLRIGIISSISSILSLLITPLISVVMYFDLRAKKNEFTEVDSPDDPSEPNKNVDIF